jgi:hypothetical protein
MIQSGIVRYEAFKRTWDGKESKSNWAIDILNEWIECGQPPLVGPPAEQVQLAKQILHWEE